MTMVSALYVETGGCYFGLPNVDPWDKARDARRFQGPGPVVAHPPCERWGRYSEGGPSHHGQFRTGDDGGCFHAALAAVLEHGGVLEHPEASKAWDAYGLVKPPRTGGWVPQGDNLWTCCVYQAQYGHVAPKATWLLYSSPDGIDPPELRWGFEGSSLPTQSAARSAARQRGGRSTNDAIERMSKRQRQATPEPFRDVLLALARHAVSGSRGARQPRGNGARGGAIQYGRTCAAMVSDAEDVRANARERWGQRGAGAVFYSPDTGRILLGLRSEHVMEPGTWGGFGGKIDDDDVDPLDAMLREVSEETEYDADDMLAAELIWVYEKPDFRYYNYLVVVRHEFEPVLNWENEEALWVDPRHLPKPLHYGMKALLPHLRAHLGL